MNLIKALEGLSVNPDKGNTEEPQTNAPTQNNAFTPPEQTADVPNVMASVLERHERISNRVRNNGGQNK